MEVQRRPGAPALSPSAEALAPDPGTEPQLRAPGPGPSTATARCLTRPLPCSALKPARRVGCLTCRSCFKNSICLLEDAWKKERDVNTSQQQACSSGLAAVSVQRGSGGLLCSPEHIPSERSVSLSACSGGEGWAQVAAPDTGRGVRRVGAGRTADLRRPARPRLCPHRWPFSP